MNCDDVKDLVHAHADDELDVITAREVEDHLNVCKACRGKLGEVRAVKGAVAGQYFRSPKGLREKVLDALGEDENSSEFPRTAARSRAGAEPERFFRSEREKREFSSWWRLIALAAAVVIVGGLVFLISGRQEDRLVAEVLTAHLRSLQAGHLMDVESTDQHTVKPWFDTRVDFSPPVRQLKDQGFPLLGGRLDYLEDRAVAALVYSRGKHLINLFAWPGGGGGGVSERRGFNVLHWSDGGMTFWAVSDLNREELEKFEKLFREGAGASTAASG